MHLLLDCDLSSRGLVRLLEKRGHDVLAAGLVGGLRELDDVDLFELAQREHRIVLTHNLADFPDILVDWGQSGRTHHGCILSRLPANAYAEIVRRLDRWLMVYPTQGAWRDLAVWL